MEQIGTNVVRNKLVDFINYYKWRPYEFVIDVIRPELTLWNGETHLGPTFQQAKVLKAIPEAFQARKPVVIKSGHGTGKTALISWLTWWFVLTRPFPNVPSTAPTQHQLYDVLWKEHNRWFKKIPKVLSEEFEVTATHVKHKRHPSTWFAVARTASTPDALQGFHADHVMFIIEEASGVDQEIIVVAEGALTGSNNFMVMIGNPTKIEGSFFDAFGKNRSFNETFTFNCEESEIVDPAYCEDMARKYGKDSDIYRVRVLGEFPMQEPDTFLGIDKVEAAIAREDQDYKTIKKVNIGADIARYGDDEIVFCVRRGWKIIGFEKYSKMGIDETAGRLLHLIREVESANLEVVVAIDDSGLGGGVTDLLRHYRRVGKHRAKILAENNGSKALDDEEFHNRGTELWWQIKTHIGRLDLLDDSTLLSELTTRKYKITPSGRIVLEDKTRMKERGLKSPDRADALSLTFADMVTKGVPAGSVSL